MPKLTTAASPKNNKGAKNGKPKNGKVAPPPTPNKPEQPVLYPHIEFAVCIGNEKYLKPGEKPSPFTIAQAKELLGWQEETESAKFGGNYLAMDYYGKKIRCTNNLTNRPFYMETAEAWKSEVLRRKWQPNGETIIVDKYGNVHDGQHRLFGLILAAQEWELDAKRTPEQRAELQIPVEGWASFWPEEPWCDFLIVFGISNEDAVVNTIGTGRKRTFADAFYRSSWVAGLAHEARKHVSKMMENALKLLWLRSAADLNSFAPHRPHSESFEFLASHPKLVDCVKFIRDENHGRQPPEGLAQYYPTLGHLAALLYLMGSAASDVEAKGGYNTTLNEKSLTWKLWEKAQEFFVLLSSNSKVTGPLGDALLNIPGELSGGFDRDLRTGMIIKAWNLFADGKKIVHTLGEGGKVSKSNIEMEIEYQENQPVLTEHPRCGGIDVSA